MTGDPYYNKSVRNMLVAFSTLFNNISIARLGSDGSVDSTIKVPVIISNKAKWYRKLNEEIREKPKAISRILPRMAIDLVGMRYDSSRQGIPTIKFVNDVPVLDSSSSSNAAYFTTRKKSYQRVPYTYDLEIAVATKTMTDALMIVEQILPTFKPDHSVTINDHTDLGIDTDVSFTIKDITKESNRFETFDELDLITWTIGFDAKGYIYAPVSNSGVILNSIVDIYETTSATSRVANITASTISEVPFDIDDEDTFTTVITEYINGVGSSSSSSS